MREIVATLFVFSFLFYSGLCGEFGRHGLRKGRLEDMPKAMPPPESNRTIFKYHIYELQSNTTIVDGDGQKIVQRTHFTYSWDQIHYDLDSGTTVRFALLNCFEGDCRDIEVNRTFFVGLRQGRLSLRGLYKNATDEMPVWNVLHSVLHMLTLPYEDRTESWTRAHGPYGECSYRFSKKNDQRHLREVKNCDFDLLNNRTLFGGLVAQSYESDVELNLDKKYNGKLHLIRGSEKLRVQSPLHAKFGYEISSEFRVDMIYSNDSYHYRYCNGTWSLAKCAEHMELDVVGTTWPEVMANIHFVDNQNDKFGSFGKSKNEAWVFSVLLRMFDGMAAHEFVEILDGTPDEQKHEHLQAFAAVGEIDLAYMRKHLNDAEFAAYLRALGYRLEDKTAALLEIKKFLNDDKTHAAVSTFAALLNGKCHESATKLHACNSDEHQDVGKLLQRLETCNLDGPCDGHHAYAALEQLPIERVCKRALQEVCSAGVGEHEFVLNVLSRCDPAFFTPKDVRKLLNVFNDACFEPVQDNWSLQALDILFRIYAKQPLAGTLLLRSEVEALKKPEKWAYFHSAERAFLAKDLPGTDGWKQLRSFKVFQREYNNQAIKGDSKVDFYTIPIKNVGQLDVTLRALGANTTRTHDFELSFRSKNREVELILLRQQAGGKNKLRLMGVAYPDFQWEAQTFKLPLSNLNGDLPLIGGLALDVRSNAEVSLRFVPEANSRNFRLKAQLHVETAAFFDDHALHSVIAVDGALGVRNGHVDVGEVDVRQFNRLDKAGRDRQVRHPGRSLIHH
ncbi:hypothetical protein M3Y99_01426400 [Aphelenchoides fujianensis]|nr:hypothetical protein M3Y99_01426400 [Aphelenchoides fujianensis]